jgi:hypothetical protein
LKSVRELVYKRGFGKVNKARKPLTDNSIIEKALGKQFRYFERVFSVMKTKTNDFIKKKYDVRPYHMRNLKLLIVVLIKC